MDYAALTTQELQQLLRDDFKGGKRLPDDELMSVLDELVRRCPPAKSAEEAWAEFQEHYAQEAYDPTTPHELTPSPGGRECLGNGTWPGYACQCCDCDFYEICFPDWEGHKED